MKHLQITIGDQVFRAKLMTETAPEFVKVFESYLPLEGLANHAKICDNEFFIPLPLFRDEKENPVFPEAGDIGYFPVRQTVCFWYDVTNPLGPTTVIAKVYPEELERLARHCANAWEKQGAYIKYEIAGDDQND